MIQRHIWADYLEEAEHLRHHHEIKSIYAKRKETIERIKGIHTNVWIPLLFMQLLLGLILIRL